MVLDIKKAQAAASKLFPTNVKLSGGAKRVTNKVTSAAQAAKNSGVFFPDATTRGVATPEPTPFEYSTTKPQNQSDLETVTATGGTRTLTFNGQTTGALNHNASAATIRAALEALGLIANEDITVTGDAGGPYTHTFGGQYAGVDVPAMTTTPSLRSASNTATVTLNNRVQTITLGAGNTGGDFTITYDGQTTAPIAFDATGATVVAALEALSNIGVGDVTCPSGAGGPYVITAAGALAGTDMAVFTTTPSLTGGVNTADVTINSEEQTITLGAGVTGGTFTLTYSGQTTTALAYNATGATVQTALRALSNLADTEVSVAGGAGGPYVVSFIGALANTNVPTITTTPTLFGPNNTVTVVKGDGYQTLTIGAGINAGTYTITFNGQTTAAIAWNASAAQVQAAMEALSNVEAASADVNVTQTGSGPYYNVYTWSGAYKNIRVEFSVDPASLTGGTSTVRRTAESMEEVIARQKTREALGGLSRPSSQVDNDVERLAQRQPVDIGQAGRIAGEDYGKIA